MIALDTVRIRRLEPSHAPALERALEACGAFPPEEAAVCRQLLETYLRGCPPDVYEFFAAVRESDGRPVGFLCSGNASMADRVFELYWIFVDPGAQHLGVGRRLMAYFEELAARRGMRMSVIHTSGRAEYEPARRLYASCGYREAARLRDFYRAGDDLVVFRKDHPSSAS